MISSIIYKGDFIVKKIIYYITEKILFLMNGFSFINRIIGEVPKTERRKHMKKLFKSIITAGLIIAVCGTTSFVSEAAHGCISVVDHNGSCAYYFLDADGDGICHNYSSGRHWADTKHCGGYVDADGNGSDSNAAVLNETVHHSEYTNGYGNTGGQGSTGGHGHFSGHGHSGKHGHSH